MHKNNRAGETKARPLAHHRGAKTWCLRALEVGLDLVTFESTRYSQSVRYGTYLVRGSEYSLPKKIHQSFNHQGDEANLLAYVLLVRGGKTGSCSCLECLLCLISSTCTGIVCMFRLVFTTRKSTSIFPMTNIYFKSHDKTNETPVSLAPICLYRHARFSSSHPLVSRRCQWPV
jgi:hypothetical protein